VAGNLRRRFIVFVGAALSASLAGAPASHAGADELVKFTVVDDNEIRESLTGKPGNPDEGRKIAADRGLGNCLACHFMPIGEDLQGNVGPELKGVASRLKESEIRLRIVNAKLLNPQTAMPAFYRVDGLYRVRKDLAGKPILTAEQVENVVAYMMTLKE
jgi:sulfur-oxidizing protein SoxX